MIPKLLKFLLIDDVHFQREKLLSSLLKLGFDGPYSQAENGEEAISMLKKASPEPFEFIICDIQMPVMDGISFLRRIKEESLLSDPTPILMLTAENERKIVMECLKLGATNYLLKPWDTPEIAKKILASWEKIHGEG